MKLMPFHLLIFSILMTPAFSEAAARKSLLNNDPNVIYIGEHIEKKIYLIVAKNADVFSSKRGRNKLGTYPKGAKVELLALGGKNIYRVKGRAKHSMVSGWVSAKMLKSDDDKLIANLNTLYKRKMIVKELVANKEVAIGMTLVEVEASLGKATKTEIKQTRKGNSGSWSYIISKEQKHYRTVIDPSNGRVYRQLSHITTEEKQRTTLEFQNDIVTTISRKVNNGVKKVRIIPVPVIFRW